MLQERLEHAQWLELSGLPLLLNKVRSGGWPVFKKIVELDCRAHRCPGLIEVTLDELAERTGYDAEAVRKIVESLRRKKYIKCFLPDNSAEEALIEVRVPIATPLSPEQVAARMNDPLLRDASVFRYARAEEQLPADEARVQEVVDLYLNHLSQKINTFVLEQIEIAVRRFPLESIRLTIERAERHNLRSMGWVLKELIRDYQKREKEAGTPSRS